MKSKLLHDKNGLKTFALVFDEAEEVKQPLLRFALERLGRLDDFLEYKRSRLTLAILRG